MLGITTNIFWSLFGTICNCLHIFFFAPRSKEQRASVSQRAVALLAHQPDLAFPSNTDDREGRESAQGASLVSSATPPVEVSNLLVCGTCLTVACHLISNFFFDPPLSILFMSPDPSYGPSHLQFGNNYGRLERGADREFSFNCIDLLSIVMLIVCLR